MVADCITKKHQSREIRFELAEVNRVTVFKNVLLLPTSVEDFLHFFAHCV